jgi:curved DNA-binding protein CbpA
MSLYKILGVREGANPAEIEMAFAALSKNPNLSAIEQIEITGAYHTLMNPSERMEYDQKNIPQMIATSQQSVTPNQGIGPLPRVSVVLENNLHPAAESLVWMAVGFGAIMMLFFIILGALP